MSQGDLAREAGLTYRTVGRLETGMGSTLETLQACQRALEARGVEFFNTSGRHGFSLPVEGH